MTRETPSLEEVLARLLTQVLALLRCDAASIFLKEGDELVLKATTARKHIDLDRISYNLGEELTGQVQSRRLGIIHEFNVPFEGYTFYDEAELPASLAKSWLGVPIVVADEVIGVLRCVISVANNKKFSEEDKLTASVFAETAGMAIEASRELRLWTSSPYAFVLMPFAASFRDTYELAIRPTLESLNFRCERVDEIQFNDSILDQIFRSIQIADLIIADMTGRNPNVFYEVGYAHALKRPVVLLTRNSADIPFDLKHHNHIIYGDSLSDLKARLRPRIEAWVQQNRNGES